MVGGASIRGADGVGGVAKCFRFCIVCLSFCAHTGVGCLNMAAAGMGSRGAVAAGPSAGEPPWTMKFPYIS